MNSISWKQLTLAMVVCLPATILQGQVLQMERVANGLANPIFATHAPTDGDRLFICQRAGGIRILNLQDTSQTPSTFMTVPSVDTTFEGGLLGMAFHPNYQSNGFFYVNYTISAGGSFRTRIARFTRTTDESANAGSLQVVLEIAQPQQNHNGGWIGFGPDGFLYIAMGDGGGGNDTGAGHTAGTGNSQDITSNLLGKMLRIDVDGDAFPGDALRNYALPPDNPYVGVTGDDEIFLYGLRNPFRCSFDRLTGDLYMGDVGQGAREEISFYPGTGNPKRNMGWRLREGIIQTPGVGGPQPADGVNPIYDYPRTGLFGGSSVTGGVVYRGPIQSLNGTYFFADYNSNNFWSFRYDGSNPDEFDGTNHPMLTRWNGNIVVDQGTLGNIVCFGEDLAGKVYVVDLFGEVFMISGAGTFSDGVLDDVVLITGTLDSGSEANLNASDDNTLIHRNVPAIPGQPAIQLEFLGTVLSPDPDELTFTVEGRVSTPNLIQAIEIFNFASGQFESFDSRPGPTADQTVVIEIDNAADYAGPNGEVRSRMTISVDGPVTTQPWALILDLVRWNILG